MIWDYSYATQLKKLLSWARLKFLFLCEARCVFCAANHFSTKTWVLILFRVHVEREKNYELRIFIDFAYSTSGGGLGLPGIARAAAAAAAAVGLAYG